MRTFVLALAFIAAPVLAQKPDQLYTASRQQLDVTKVVIAQQAAWNRGDIDAYCDFFKNAPDTVAMAGARGFPNVRMAYRIAYPNASTMGTLEQTEVDVRALGDDFALATGKYHLARNKKFGGDADGTFTEVLEKTKDGWKIIFSETN